MIDKNAAHRDDIAMYILDVQSGTRPACQWERLSVQRHVDDIERSKTDDFEYKFDFEKSCKILNFIELLPHVKGAWASKRGTAVRIQLEPWQKFNLACIFGWVRKSNGLRRFSLVYLCVPRKNGKSPIAAGIALYMLAEDGEYGAEVYCGATNEKQAWEVFRPAMLMARRTLSYLKHYGIEIHAKKLVKKADQSRFEPVIGQPGDGSSPSCAIHDEYHEHDDDGQFETMSTGMVGREQPIQLVITTAGENSAGPCALLQDDVQNILLGVTRATGEHIFGMIYSIDADDDWTTEQALVKANPNYGVSVNPTSLRRDQLYAIEHARKQNPFKTKHLNLWVSANNAWMNMEWWNACGDPSLKIEDFKGEECWIGMDLSSKQDFTGVSQLFRRMIGGKMHYYLFGRYYLPEDRINDEENRHYQQWHHDGLIIATEGARIDYEVIEKDVEDDIDACDVELLGFDPDGAEEATQRIVNAKPDVTRVEVKTTFTDISDSMKEFEAIVKDGVLHHDGNPVLAWMVSNVLAKETDNGKRIRPVRANRTKKIDGAVSAMNAFAVQMTVESDSKIDEFISDPIFI